MSQCMLNMSKQVFSNVKKYRSHVITEKSLLTTRKNNSWNNQCNKMFIIKGEDTSYNKKTLSVFFNS